VFYVYGNYIDPETYYLMIFNSWGELVFQTEDLNAGCVGTLKGLKAPNDVYVWRLKTGSKSIEKYYDKMGSVTLVR
jgi:hypothetical protein